MKRLTTLCLLATTVFSVGAHATPQPQRVRGTVVSIGGDSLIVHPVSGSDINVVIGPQTKYATVVKSSLSNIKDGSYIGTATKSTGDRLDALEVVIFPPEMRGAGEGHYPWDKIPDTTLKGGSGTTASSMTNGNVQAMATSSGARQVNSAMTNGNVEAASGKDGAKVITVSYKDGKQTITVPPTAPIVSFQPGDKSAVKKGETVFVSASEDAGKITANFVAVGTEGVKPPM
jgi:hypothetical protein